MISVLVTLDAPLEDVLPTLRTRGLQVLETMPIFGIVRGLADPAHLAALGDVPGVAAVEQDRERRMLGTGSVPHTR